MTSNNERVVPAGDKERRFFVVRVASNHLGESRYWKQLLDDKRDGGLQNLLYHLRSIDLSDFDVTKIPQTKELREQQEHNLSHELDWLLGKLDTGQWFADGRTRWEGPLRKKQLHEDYRNYLTSINARFIKGERAFHHFIMNELPGTIDKQVYGKDAHDRPMVFVFPSLAVCRERFDKKRGWHGIWRKIDDSSADEPSNVLHLPGTEVKDDVF
jgi:hypothetical protein